MKLKFWKPVVTIFLILFSVAFLWNGFLLYLAGFVRVHTAVEITDKNRDIIVLMQENAQEYGGIPNMQDAVKMEYLDLMHKSEVTVYYADETTHRCYIEDDSDPLSVYLQKEGYNIYFKSKDFLIDLMKVIVLLALTAISAIFLIKKRSKV